MTRDTPPKRKTWTTGRPMTIAVVSFLFLISCVAVWSVKATINGAVIGSGVIEISQTLTTVQHPIGGIVEEIYAQNGDRVQAGDLLVRLDSRQLQSDLTVVEIELFEDLANIARLHAVLSDSRDLVLPPILAEGAQTRPEIQIVINRQEKQLDAYLAAQDAGIDLLGEQITQVEAEIAGTEAQLSAKRDEREFLAKEIESAQKLSGRGLIKLSDLFRLQRTQVGIRGDIGRFEAKIAELRGKISELTLKRLAIIPTANEKAQEALSKLRTQRTRNMEKRASLMRDLARLDIRAPINGKVHASQLQGAQSVVQAAKPLMTLVPEDTPIRIGVRITASDIDQVFVGQDASLKFNAFSGRDVPIILGQISRISADAILDPLTKKHYYEVKVGLLDNELAKLGERQLLPGMPVEAYLSTERRTPLSYVMRPIQSYLDRAFRDT